MISSGTGLLLARLESVREKHFLRLYFGQLQGFSEMPCSGLWMVQLRFQLPQHSVKKVVGFESSALLNGRKCLEASLRPAHVGDRHRAVEGDDRRIVQFNALVVENQDSLPVGALIIPRGTVAGGNARLEMVFRDFIAA